MPLDEPAPAAANPEPRVEPLVVPPGLLVAHALGGVGGVPYTNSMQAFECNYQRGFRWFEVDLALTNDGALVCFHPGQEQIAGLEQPVDKLTLAQVEGQKYAGRFPIPRFETLLDRADELGDVVIVTDTKGWPPPMLEAVKRVVTGAPGTRRKTRLVLQSYGERDIGAVKQLSREIGGDVILTLYMTGADDPHVEAMAREFGVLAVVADERRFTPWLATRLHELDLPILVHTINDHRDVMRLTRAGVDGFYTDAYRPYESAATDRHMAQDCDANYAIRDELADWVERDVLRPGDYILKPCAQRGPGGVELFACDGTAAVWGPFLAIPPNHTLHVQLDVESGPDGSDLWLEVLQKNHGEPVRAREPIRLAPNERRAMSFDVALTSGSPGIETRLGVDSELTRVVIHTLKASHTAIQAPEQGGGRVVTTP